jgi:hypothetical protein
MDAGEYALLEAFQLLAKEREGKGTCIFLAARFVALHYVICQGLSWNRSNASAVPR